MTSPRKLALSLAAKGQSSHQKWLRAFKCRAQSINIYLRGQELTVHSLFTLSGSYLGQTVRCLLPVPISLAQDLGQLFI